MKNTFELLKFKDKIRPLGRYQILSDGIGCDHCATGIELCFEGVGEITLSLYTTVKYAESQCSFSTVV